MELLATLSLALAVATGATGTHARPGDDDPAPPRDLPGFWAAGLEDVERELRSVVKGRVETIAVSPGGRPVRSVTYGEADDLRSQANYGSAVGAGSAAYYARKDATTKPVILFLGPVHGQEIEGIVGLVNLIRVAETGRDHRGQVWPELARRLARARVVIVPCANPDGRARCPYDSFVGLPTRTMTKYGQGTRRDGSPWGWPGAKAVHPMKGDVGILGAYFNDDGVNLMHDDFFLPMAREMSSSFNLVSALHHVSGALAFTFECSHGSLGEESRAPLVSHAQILDIQLTLYEEMLGFALENRPLWVRPAAGGR